MSNRGVNNQLCVGRLEIAGTGLNLFVHSTEEWNGRHRFHVNAALDMSKGTGMTLVQDEGRPFTYQITKHESRYGEFWTFEQVYRGSKSYRIFMNPKLEAALNWILSEL